MDSDTNTSQPIQNSVPVQTVSSPLEKPPVNKFKKSILFFIFFIIASILIAGVIWIGGEKLIPQQKACTQEAKQCPDGSFVGRTGPNCEFSACPTIKVSPVHSQNPASGLKTYASKYFSFEYPQDWYVNQYDSPQSIQLSDLDDSITKIQGGSKDFTRIDIAYSKSPMPSSFPFTNGSSNNPTIKAFSINNYTGIKGQQSSTAGLVEVVYLQNNVVGYVSLMLIPPLNDDRKALTIFNQVLQTFKFLD